MLQLYGEYSKVIISVLLDAMELHVSALDLDLLGISSMFFHELLHAVSHIA